jgi:hypothetical protein
MKKFVVFLSFCLLLALAPSYAKNKVRNQNKKITPITLSKDTKKSNSQNLLAPRPPKKLAPKTVSGNKKFKDIGENQEVGFGVDSNAGLPPSEAANPIHDSIHEDNY